MQTHLAPEFKDTPDGTAAEAILRKCVHCGFCAATCPTYQLLGDELDGPRGRIYLIKQVLEGARPTRSTQLHLDRCLTCRNCETTCPSGVRYGQLVDIGRRIVDAQVDRPAAEAAARWALMEGMTSSAFAPALKLGRMFRGLLPEKLRNKVPADDPNPRAHEWPQREHARKVLMLAGCVQPALMPNINAATARVFDAVGIQVVVAPEVKCCGAIRSHLDDHEGGLDDMRRNIDAWWPLVSKGAVEAVVMNASGCAAMVKDYARSLAHDRDYASPARRIVTAARDLSELLPTLVPLLKPLLHDRAKPRLVFHPPCTLQHGQQVRGVVEDGLAALGFEVSLPAAESHLCCGSSGTYSVLQPLIANTLRDRKLGHIAAVSPPAEVIVSANIGCIQHLQTGTTTPVRHWVEVIDELLVG
jgi:glycolate oxidase iron-sulfur subunit